MTSVSAVHPRLRTEVASAQPSLSSVDPDNQPISPLSPAGSTAPLLGADRSPRSSEDGLVRPVRAEPWARRQARGAYAGFFAFGATYGGWQARMPELKQSLKLDNRTLGLLLGASTMAELSCSWGAGPLTRAIGARSSQALIALTFPLAVAALAAGRTTVEAVPMALLIGASGGLYDNLINTAASIAEEGGVASAMSTAHGLASVGSLVGGGVAAGAEQVELPLLTHLLTAGLALALLGVWGAQQVRGEPRGPSTSADDAEANLASETASAGTTQQQPAKPVPLVRSVEAYRLAGINLTSSLAEGALYEWSSIYLRDVLGVAPAVAAGGYVGVVASMAATRLFISPRLEGYTLRCVLVGSGSLAAVSMGTALLLHRPEAALVGLSVTGAGLSIITPRIAGEMGRRFPQQRNAAMAWNATGQACGFFTGPPLIGLLAGSYGLTRALALVPALAGISALLSATDFAANEPRRTRALGAA